MKRTTRVKLFLNVRKKYISLSSLFLNKSPFIYALVPLCLSSSVSVSAFPRLSSPCLYLCLRFFLCPSLSHAHTPDSIVID